jgi:hypothetical protein
VAGFVPQWTYEELRDTFVARQVISMYAEAYHADDTVLMNRLNVHVISVLRMPSTSPDLIRMVLAPRVAAQAGKTWHNFEQMFWDVSTVASSALRNLNCPVDLLTEACQSPNLRYAETAADNLNCLEEWRVFVALRIAAREDLPHWYDGSSVRKADHVE